METAVYFTIREIKEANAAIDGHWFDQSVMRFFRSRVSGPVIANMFVSSESHWDPSYPFGIRRYTIRVCENGHINTVGDFHQYETKRAAVNAMRRIAKEGN